MPEKRNRSFVTFEKCYLDKIDWYDSSEVYNDLVMLFENANKNLLKIDSALIKGNVSERTICAALMLHLSKSLKKTPFHKYFTDVEYNRNKNGIVKTIIDENEVITTITCDLIVHSRGSYTQQDNLIALEMKKSNRKKTEKQKDKNRLIALTKEKGGSIMSSYRVEHDSMGQIQVPADVYWGAQTQRSYENFKIGTEKMPAEIIRAFAILKKAAAMANFKIGKLDQKRCDSIGQVCDEILAGKLDEQFPLVVWQTGSGTQSNMNLNEVIANRGNEMAGEKLLHPNDHVNMSQSSNDTFPTAMHIAAYLEIKQKLLPAVQRMIEQLSVLEEKNQQVIKTGRTHLQDATPITFGQEISGWRAMLEKGYHMLEVSLPGLSELALGGTAVGTGLNAPAGFGEAAAEAVSSLTGEHFITAPNKFHSLTAKDELVFAHGALKALAANLMKIANDIRWLASGPRCGLGEIHIPENEPGSSIMPGKVNPTQCEAVTMVAVQVMANDTAIGVCASQGNFELNVYMPVCIYNFLQSVRLLTDVLDSFRIHCVAGIEVNEDKMKDNLQRSLMLVTALNPYIGYENAAKTAKKAYAENISLKEACVSLGFLTEEQFDEILRPEKMV